MGSTISRKATATASSTLVLIKPDATIRRNIGASILKDLLNKGFIPLRFAEVHANDALIKMHYSTKVYPTFHHYSSEKQIMDLTTRYMTAGSILAIEFTEKNGTAELWGNNIVNKMRFTIGSYNRSTLSTSGTYNTSISVETTDQDEDDQCELREKYAINRAFITTIHASKNVEEAQREIRLWNSYFDCASNKVMVEKQIRDYIDKYIDEKYISTQYVRQVNQELTDTIRKLKYNYFGCIGETYLCRDIDKLKNVESIKILQDKLTKCFQNQSSDHHHTNEELEQALKLASVIIDDAVLFNGNIYIFQRLAPAMIVLLFIVMWFKF